jgi:uncharacterized protein YkwD
VRRAALAAAAAALALAACVAPSPAPRAPVPAPPRAGAAVPAAALEQEMHALVNQHRTRMRLPPFQYDERIAAIAREHSQAMADHRRPFSHDGFDARTHAILAFIDYHGVAENVAYDNRTGPALGTLMVQGWINSPPHLQNIQGAYDVAGIGVARSADGFVYATQIFVKR